MYEGDFKDGKKDGIGTYNCQLYKYIGEWKNNTKNKTGTYYLNSGNILEVFIENNSIKEGVYKVKGSDDMYLQNVDISNEKEVLENLSYYLKNENCNEITLNTPSLYN